MGKTNLYVAKVIVSHVTWVGICKHYMHDGKNILSFRFMREGDGILEMIAEQKEASEKIQGFYRCHLSTRQFGTEKYETEAEWEKEIKLLEDGKKFISCENDQFFLRVETAEDFSDFCQNN